MISENTSLKRISLESKGECGRSSLFFSPTRLLGSLLIRLSLRFFPIFSSDGHSAMTDATGGTGSEKDATNGNGTPSGSQESVKSSATVETPEALGLTP